MARENRGSVTLTEKGLGLVYYLFYKDQVWSPRDSTGWGFVLGIRREILDYVNDRERQRGWTSN